jgi:hypothetical protein
MVQERGLPLDEADGHRAGWRAHIKDLGIHLAGQTPRDWRRRWLELLPVVPGGGDG